MKSSTERTGCDNCSCRSSRSSIFLQEKCYLFGKIDYLKKFLFSFFFVEKQLLGKVLGKIQFLKSIFLWCISIANSSNIKHVPPALAGVLVYRNLDIQKFWFTLYSYRGFFVGGSRFFSVMFFNEIFWLSFSLLDVGFNSVASLLIFCAKISDSIFEINKTLGPSF